MGSLGNEGTWTNSICAGVEAAAGDSNVWKDSTTGGCTGAGSDCRFRDKISGLDWTETIGVAKSWPDAVETCRTLTHDGLSGWRLPTQKEAMAAYEHGIRGVARTNWITQTQMSAYFWTATTEATAAGLRFWIINYETGLVYAFYKGNTYYTTCVR